MQGELTKMTQEQEKAMREITAQAKAGGGGSEDMIRLLELQKNQLNNESERLRSFMRDFMDQMIKMQDNNASTQNAYGGGFDKQAPAGKAEGHSQVQMQQIGNVFYNLMNMIGTQNRDERMIGISNDLRELI